MADLCHIVKLGLKLKKLVFMKNIYFCSKCDRNKDHEKSHVY